MMTIIHVIIIIESNSQARLELKAGYLLMAMALRKNTFFPWRVWDASKQSNNYNPVCHPGSHSATQRRILNTQEM